MSDILDHSQLVEILKTSIEKLEIELKQWTNDAKKESNGHLLWATTWVELRQDDLVGLNWYYFLEQLIIFIRNSFNIDVISIDLPVMSSVAAYMQSRHKNLLFPKKLEWQERMRKQCSPYKLLKDLVNKPTKKGLTTHGYWFSSPINTHKHRYRDLLEQLSNQYTHQFFHANHNISVKVEDSGESLNFSAWAKGSDLSDAWRNGYRLSRYVHQAKRNSLLVAFLQSMRTQHFAGMLVRERWIERAILELKPKGIFFTTAITYSPARLMSRLAYQYGIPFYIVACRSMFTALRMEERSISADHEKINDAHVADAFIVWDEFSRQTLISQGFQKDGIYLHQSNKGSNKIELELSNRFLLLFTHDKDQNEALIKVLEELRPTGAWAIRMHPLQPLTANQENKLQSILPEYQDTSNVKMNSIDFHNIIAISINSTAAVEACSYGAGLLWLPFLNFRAIVFDEVISILGEKAHSMDDFERILEKYESQNERNRLIQECQEAFRTHFVGTDNLNVFLEKLEA